MNTAKIEDAANKIFCEIRESADIGGLLDSGRWTRAIQYWMEGVIGEAEKEIFQVHEENRELRKRLIALEREKAKAKAEAKFAAEFAAEPKKESAAKESKKKKKSKGAKDGDECSNRQADGKGDSRHADAEGRD